MQFRKHLRLKEFDYSSENYYFVTICTGYRVKLFESRTSWSNFEKEVVRTTSSPITTNTDIVEKILLDLPNYYNNLIIDFYVIMPDHLHVILGFEGIITSKTKPTSSRHYSLGDIVGIFKQVATKQLHKHIGVIGSIFQPNFYEHVIRNEKSLEKIRQYILNNPIAEHHNIPWNVLDLK